MVKKIFLVFICSLPILWLIGVVHSYFVYRLSMQGHDFLEDLRNQEVWDKIKNQAFKSGANLTWTFYYSSN